MNPISKTHKLFSARLNNPRVLTNPEEFLGENFKAVLNFWILIDKLDVYSDYDKIKTLSKCFKKLKNYESLREEFFNTSTITSRIKVILLNMDYGVFSFFNLVNNYTALATLELTVEQPKHIIIQHFINEFSHS
jgi:hypothetical protein